MSNSNLYSYHVFLLPFQWQFAGLEMKNKTLQERTCLKKFVAYFDKQHWERKAYQTDTILNYNEYNYYYDMVREVLFDEGKLDLEHAIVANLSYKIEPDVYTFDFKVCIDAFKNEYKCYSLHIDSIILHLYSTGVGVLSFHLNNRREDQNSPDDILRINQAGRRIYPPFMGITPDLVGTQEQFRFSDFEKGLSYTKTKELAVWLSMMSDTHFEDFSDYHETEQFKDNPFILPQHIAFLFKGIPITVSKADFDSKELKIHITPLIDDRMFVVCWYGNNELVEKLNLNGQQHGRNENKKISFIEDDWWYKYVFNDQKDITCQNMEMKRKLLLKSTYTRWSDYGTLYGVTRYSFVCLTNKLDHLKLPWVNAHFLVNHIQTIYYKLCELCLVQRACVLRFSDEVAHISAMKKDKKLALGDRVSNLYQQYLRFVNRIYFREVTAQEQGIELYDMLQEQMRIETHAKDLDHEIQELHDFVTLLEDQKQSRNINMLTIIGALFVLPTFITGFFGMNTFPDQILYYCKSFGPFMAILFIGPLIYWLINLRENKKDLIWLIVLMLAVAAILYALINTYIKILN